MSKPDRYYGPKRYVFNEVEWRTIVNSEKQAYARELLTKLKEQAIGFPYGSVPEKAVIKAVPTSVLDKLIEENSDNE